MTKRVTIHAVAEAASVSVTTVSLVLSGKGRISPATARRVNEAIDQLGFVPNRQAAALRGGQSGVIGLIVRDLSHPFYAEVTAGLTETLEQQGQLLFLTQSGSKGQHMQRCFDMLVAQGVDGVIIAGAADQARALGERAVQEKLPLVFTSRASDLAGLDTVRPDNLQAAQRVTEHLIKCGHQRIAWLGGNSASLTRAERLGGFCATLMKHALPFRSDWILECESSQKQAADAIGGLLHHFPTISAVVCHNPAVAMGAWFGLTRAGWQVGGSRIDRYYGRHIALAAFAEVAEEELDDIPVTWVTTPAREIGCSAARRILQRVHETGMALSNQVISARLKDLTS